MSAAVGSSPSGTALRSGQPTRGTRAACASTGGSPNNAAQTPVSGDNKENNGANATLGAAAAILDIGQLRFSPKLDFITTNRVVSALERAVERLQLLSLLDATAASASVTQQHTGGKNNRGASTHATTTGSAVAGAFDGLVFNPNPEAAAAAAAAAAAEEAMINNMIGTSKKMDGMRTAALFAGPQGDLLRSTAPAVNAALAHTAKSRRSGRMTVAELVTEQRQLEARYAELLRATQNVAPPQSNPTLPAQVFTHTTNADQVALAEELQATSHQLREYNKILCTQLRDNPDDADNWKKIRNERQELIALLQETIAELTAGYQESRRQPYDGTGTLSANSFRNTTRSTVHSASQLNATLNRTNGGAAASSGRSLNASLSNGAGAESESTQSVLKRFGSMAQLRRATKTQTVTRRIPLSSSFDGFARKVLQERAAQRWADALVRKERELNLNVKQLQSDLILERTMKEKEVTERQQTIHELELQLRELKKKLAQRSDDAKVHVEATAEGERRAAGEQQRELVEQSQKEQYLLSVEDRTHSLFAAHLQKKTEAMDALAAEWDAKTQRATKKAEMAKMDAEQTRQQCADRLQAREQDLIKEAELKAQRDAEREAVKCEEEAAQQQKAAEYDAASKLESALKAMLTRQVLAKQLKKGKKKKKKSVSA